MEDEIKIHFFTDRSSALGWMHHSKFYPIRDKSYDEVERNLDIDMMDFKS